MKAINILFLAPHWRVTLVKAFRKTLEDLPCAGKLAGADSNPYSPTLQALDPVHIIPRFTSPDCLRKVLDFCLREKIHAVIPLTNKAVEFLDSNRTTFYEGGIQLSLNDKK